jgi:hypothetical protein
MTTLPRYDRYYVAYDGKNTVTSRDTEAEARTAGSDVVNEGRARFVVLYHEVYHEPGKPAYQCFELDRCVRINGKPQWKRGR